MPSPVVISNPLLIHVSRHLSLSKLLGISLALHLASQCCVANANSIVGRVVGIADGDTITILDDARTQHKIRLAGIDAQEKKWLFGQRSKESLSNLVFSKTVTVETGKTDRYGREVGRVLGMAWTPI